MKRHILKFQRSDHFLSLHISVHKTNQAVEVNHHPDHHHLRENTLIVNILHWSSCHHILVFGTWLTTLHQCLPFEPFSYRYHEISHYHKNYWNQPEIYVEKEVLMDINFAEFFWNYFILRYFFCPINHLGATKSSRWILQVVKGVEQSCFFGDD